MAAATPLLIERELLRDKAANLLRGMILSGELATGTRLVEDNLASQLGISRAPLREALSLLAHEGLVNGMPGRGKFVKGLTQDSVRDLFAVRTVLEVFAAEQATAHIQPDECSQLARSLARMEQAVADKSIDGYVGADTDVHRLLWRISRNECLVQVLETLVSPLEAVIRINAEVHDDWPQVVEVHRQLIEAIASHDPTIASETMRRHMAAASDKAMVALARRNAVFRPG